MFFNFFFLEIEYFCENDEYKLFMEVVKKVVFGKGDENFI